LRKIEKTRLWRKIEKIEKTRLRKQDCEERLKRLKKQDWEDKIEKTRLKKQDWRTSSSILSIFFNLHQSEKYNKLSISKLKKNKQMKHPRLFKDTQGNAHK